MKTEVRRMPNSKGLTIRVPEDVLADVRKVRATTEIAENRTVSLNEIVIKALKEFAKTANIL